MSKLLSGHIQKRRVKCGKQPCKCARGQFHTAFYRVWYHNGQRFRQFVRKSQVESVRAACLNHQLLQIQLRHGRIEYKQIMARARLLLRMVS